MVRHGQSEYNVTRTIAGHSSIPLTELCRMQAEELSEMIRGLDSRIDVAYSSDLQRASQTTSIICDRLGIEKINYDRRLREGDSGIFTGRCVDDLTVEEKRIFDLVIVDLDSRIPGGESANEQYLRTREAFLEIVHRHPEDTTILLVGHGGTLYHILKRTLDVLPETDEWFGNCQLQVVERNSHNDS